MADPKRHFVYGLHAVSAVIDRAPERLLELWIAETRDDARSRALKDRALAVGIRVQAATGDSLAKLVGPVVHQGAVAAVRPLKPWDEHDLVAALSQLVDEPRPVAARPAQPFLLVLDGVTDPHNLGACLRTADAAGVHAVIIPKDRSAAVDVVKEQGIWVVGTEGEAEQTLYTADLNRPLALILGAEGSGMRRLTRERCDFVVRIPMAGHVESLNVSVAAGVALFEARRQRLG